MDREQNKKKKKKEFKEILGLETPSGWDRNLLRKKVGDDQGDGRWWTQPYRRKEGRLRAVGGMRNRAKAAPDLKELWRGKAVMWAGEQRAHRRPKMTICRC